MNNKQRTAANPMEAAQITPVLLTPEQAAQALGIGRTGVYALLRDGQLPSVRLGRSRRVPVSCLITFVEALQLAGREPHVHE